jgi:hypothetical protein
MLKLAHPLSNAGDTAACVQLDQGHVSVFGTPVALTTSVARVVEELKADSSEYREERKSPVLDEEVSESKQEVTKPSPNKAPVDDLQVGKQEMLVVKKGPRRPSGSPSHANKPKKPRRGKSKALPPPEPKQSNADAAVEPLAPAAQSQKKVQDAKNNQMASEHEYSKGNFGYKRHFGRIGEGPVIRVHSSLDKNDLAYLADVPGYTFSYEFTKEHNPHVLSRIATEIGAFHLRMKTPHYFSQARPLRVLDVFGHYCTNVAYMKASDLDKVAVLDGPDQKLSEVRGGKFTPKGAFIADIDVQQEMHDPKDVSRQLLADSADKHPRVRLNRSRLQDIDVAHYDALWFIDAIYHQTPGELAPIIRRCRGQMALVSCFDFGASRMDREDWFNGQVHVVRKDGMIDYILPDFTHHHPIPSWLDTSFHPYEDGGLVCTCEFDSPVMHVRVYLLKWVGMKFAPTTRQIESGTVDVALSNPCYGLLPPQFAASFWPLNTQKVVSVPTTLINATSRYVGGQVKVTADTVTAAYRHAHSRDPLATSDQLHGAVVHAIEHSTFGAAASVIRANYWKYAWRSSEVESIGKAPWLRYFGYLLVTCGAAWFLNRYRHRLSPLSVARLLCVDKFTTPRVIEFWDRFGAPIVEELLKKVCPPLLFLEPLLHAFNGDFAPALSSLIFHVTTYELPLWLSMPFHWVWNNCIAGTPVKVYPWPKDLDVHASKFVEKLARGEVVVQPMCLLKPLVKCWLRLMRSLRRVCFRSPLPTLTDTPFQNYPDQVVQVIEPVEFKQVVRLPYARLLPKITHPVMPSYSRLRFERAQDKPFDYQTTTALRLIGFGFASCVPIMHADDIESETAALTQRFLFPFSDIVPGTNKFVQTTYDWQNQTTLWLARNSELIQLAANLYQEDFAGWLASQTSQARATLQDHICREIVQSFDNRKIGMRRMFVKHESLLKIIEGIRLPCVPRAIFAAQADFHLITGPPTYSRTIAYKQACQEVDFGMRYLHGGTRCDVIGREAQQAYEGGKTTTISFDCNRCDGTQGIGALTAAQRVADAIHPRDPDEVAANISQLHTEGYTRRGIKFDTRGRMKSGDDFTSFHTSLVTRIAYENTLLHFGLEFWLSTLGDDGIAFVKPIHIPEVAMVEYLRYQFGLDVELHCTYDEPWNATYLSSTFLPTDQGWRLTPKMGRLLPKLCYCKLESLPDADLVPWLASVFEGLWNMVAHHPVISTYMRSFLDVAGSRRISIDTVDKPWKKQVPFTPARSTSLTIEWLQNRYPDFENTLLRAQEYSKLRCPVLLPPDALGVAAVLDP